MSVVVVSSVLGLAPKFAQAILEGMNRAWKAGLDPIIYETTRSQELQTIYFNRGASKQRDVRKSWHRYGLAVDIISKTLGWHDGFYAKLAPIMLGTGLLKWGGHWTSFVDKPHFYWSKCRDAPSDRALELLGADEDGTGVRRVWVEVRAA